MPYQSKVAGNEVIDIWGGTHDGTPHLWFYDRQTLDTRAKMVMELVKLWGFSLSVINMAQDSAHEHGCEDGEPLKLRPPQEVIMRAADMVEAFWDEMKHRGWLLEIPAADEVDK